MFGMLPIYHLAQAAPTNAVNANPATRAIGTVLGALQSFGVPAGILLAVCGALMQTTLFHSTSAPRKGPE